MTRMTSLGMSGVDLNSILDGLLQAKQRPLTAMQTQKSRVDAAMNAWTGINTDLSALTDIMDSLRMASSFKPSKITGTDDKIATATANGELQVASSYQLKVSQLAAAQTMYSRQFSGTTAMGSAGTLTLASSDGEKSFAIDYTAEMTVSQVAKAINEALKPAEDAEEGSKPFLSASVVDGRLVLTAAEGGSSNGFTIADSNATSPFGNFQVASGLAYRESQSFQYSDVQGLFGSSITLKTSTGKEVNIAIDTANDTLETLVEKINRQFRDATGEAKSAVQMAGSEGNYTLRFDASVVSEVSGGFSVNNSDIKYSGQDALLSVNGLMVRSASNEVNLVEGMKISLKETGSTTMTVQSAADDVVANVKSFVEKFNTVYAAIKKRMENTLPSTLEADSTKMTNLLNARDPLVSDSSLKGLASDLQDLFSFVSDQGDVKTLSSLGIDIDREGKVTLDEAKLKKAVEKDADAVSTFFRGVAAEEGSATRVGGFANKVSDLLKSYTNAATGIIAGQKSFYEEMSKSYTDQITRLNESIKKEQESLTIRFSKIDVAIAESNRKLSQLQSALSGVSSSTSGALSMMGL